MNRYEWNRSLIEPFTSMSLTGIRYDTSAAAAMRASIVPRVWTAQATVDELAGVRLPDSTAELLEAAAAQCCHKVRLRKQLKGYVDRIATGEALPEGKRKKYSKVVIPPRPLSWQLCAETANQGKTETLHRLRELAESEQSAASRAEIASLLAIGVNVESPEQVIETLDHLGLPAKWKRGKHDPNDPEAGRTSDEESLLELFMGAKNEQHRALTQALLEARSLRTALSWLDAMHVDADGRVRCSFANPGSETGRVLTRTWHSGSGGNLQAVSTEPFNFRTLLAADPGHLMAQVDLRSADAWTVAARCAQHGDRTMLLDLQAGVRIPSLIALLMAGTRLPEDRTELKALCKTVVKDWRDYAYKKGTYLSFYMGSAGLIQRETVRESWSATGTPIDPGKAFCQEVQATVLRRYWGLQRWWAEVERQVRRDGTLTGASGQTREFLSRRWTGEGALRRLDHSTHKEVIASEPQMVTTYATNLALWRLWTDPHNWVGRVGEGTPYVQPLLHIHDALLVQFAERLVAPAGRKLTQWFDNPVRIGNVTVTIPQSAGWGASWGECAQAFPP